MNDVMIIWRRFDQPGHESARLFFQVPNWHLMGTVVFVHARQPCRLDYHVVCNSNWETMSARVAGWVGQEIVAIEVAVDAERRWWLNGSESVDVAGCVDIDLNFSPSTNLLPIRRLTLSAGEVGEVEAAWLCFPSFTLEPLGQVYQRSDANTYRYKSAGGAFVRELQVNEVGFVTHYPDFWMVESD